MANIKATTIAATMEPAVTRRRVLLGLGAATATAAVLAAPNAAKSDAVAAGTSIDEFLARASASERAWYHATQLAATLGEITPTHDFYVSFDKNNRFALVGSLPKEAPPPAPVYDGPGLYEVALTTGTRPILWLERFEYATTPGHFYMAQLRWKNKPQEAPRRLREKQIHRIIRKIEDGRA